MRTVKHTDRHTVIVAGPVISDFKIMLQDVKKLDEQIKRLSEAVNAYRMSTIDQFIQ